MTGDIIEIDGQLFEVVWNGEEGLIPARQTKVQWDWEPPRRMYNRTGRHRKVDNRDMPVNTGVILGETNVGSGVTGIATKIVG